MNEHPPSGHGQETLWAIVLAGGDGTRLGSISTELYGYARPKQFCALLGEETLVEQTVRRAELVVPRQQIVVSTTRRWRREAAESLARVPGVHTVEQPANAGTTPGLLLALLAVLARDPDSRVVILPADHHISNDASFMGAALAATAGTPPPVVLLGAHLEHPEEGLGWIRYRRTEGRVWFPIEGFVEKPDPASTAELHASGALANTFAMVARTRDLAALIAAHVPRWWQALRSAHDHPEQMEAIYRALPPSDLSREVLQPSAATLGVAPLLGTIWSDIGTPERLARAVTPAARVA